MKDVPLISVLMPACNHARYVEDAVRSVIAQDWPRVEFVAVDDGSADDTPRVLRSLAPECEKKFERTVVLFQENRGTCATLNRLLGEAKGEYVGVIASDDMYLPGALTALAAALAADPATGLAVGRNQLMDGEGRRCYWDASRKAVYDPADAVYLTLNDQMAAERGVSGDHPGFGTYCELLHTNHVANGALIRAECLKKVEPCSKRTPLEDWWLMLQLSKITRMRSIGAETFRYRWHDMNTVKQSERMNAYYRLNLAEEERVLCRDRDWPHLEAFLGTHAELRRSRGVAGLYRRRRYSTLFSRITVVEIAGLKFAVRRERKEKEGADGS
ncbi:MAG: glycosyltransferase family 2 protein [Kiritimatiellae bacterium]|nr:glycosyltransferase family 2 protein [Kiritimatiellia bacterium]